jgi:hypothetical protein
MPQSLPAAYLRPAVSNGHPQEQALIRQWWHEVHGGRGRIVWEYYLGDCYADAVWFPDADENGAEYPGRATRSKFPISGESIVVCEAKLRLTAELMGQALLYRYLARAAGATVRSVVLFAKRTSPSFKDAAHDAGFEVVIRDAV